MLRKFSKRKQWRHDVQNWLQWARTHCSVFASRRALILWSKRLWSSAFFWPHRRVLQWQLILAVVVMHVVVVAVLIIVTAYLISKEISLSRVCKGLSLCVELG